MDFLSDLLVLSKLQIGPSRDVLLQIGPAKVAEAIAYFGAEALKFKIQHF